MAHGSGGDIKSPQALLRVLCSKITGLKDDAVSPYYKMSLAVLGSTVAMPVESDEFEVAEKIKKKLVRQHREKDAAVFAELHRKLQAQELLKNRWSLLYLLMRLGEDPKKQIKGHTSAFMQGLSAASTPALHRGLPESTPSTFQKSSLSHASSGISSIHGSARSNDPSFIPQSLAPSHAVTPFSNYRAAQAQNAQRLLQTVDKYHISGQTDSSHGTQLSNTRSSWMARVQKERDNTSFELPESTLLRELVYIFQGIEGQYIQFGGLKEGFKIDSKVGIPKTMRKTICKLAECGWLYNKIRKYADSRSTDRAFGLVGQSFCAALHQELTEYYRLMAVLESQLQQEEDQGVSVYSGGFTLRRLAVWSCDPLVRLKTLAALVDVCQGKKGGSLASAIHSYIQHGDPSVRELVRHTLTLVAQPVFSTVLRWIYDGELEDTYHEFFVASDPTVSNDQLWHDKYTLRKSMIPSFITMDQARKILLTGKSINFLRQVCQDRTTMRHRDDVKSQETSQVESIFSDDMDGVFQKMIDTVYKATSHHLLDVFHTKYKFMDHLKAMRRYLLLGQGDFIRHLMDLLEDDLAKPAGTLFLHNLTGILETAIRATNAQYDDADILKRVDVRLLEVSPGDTGWDVFSLHYHVAGPIKTVFTPDSIITYLRVFNFLWRAKRMEYILAGIWKGQMANNRILRTIPVSHQCTYNLLPTPVVELSSVLHQCNVIAAEMVHFVQQVQYYINFEVLECSWDELLKKVQEAEDLDHIIAAHNAFLAAITKRSLLDQNSAGILAQLRTIFDRIIQFQTILDSMYQAAADELCARQNYEEKQKRQSEKGDWGLTDAEEDAEENRRAQFTQTLIPTTRSQLRVVHSSYQDMVQQFLVMLNSHSDLCLRFLSYRLDFNEHYRAKEPKLHSPMAYHKVKRCT